MAEVAEKKVVVKQPSLRFPDFNGKIRIDNLGKYIDVISGYPFKGEDISEINNGIPLLRGINITEGFIRHNADIDRYYNKSINGLEKYLLETGDVVLGMDGSKVGKNVSIIQSKDAGSLLVQRIARIRPKANCDIKFVYQQIYSTKFHRYVDKVNTSSGIPHISLKQIKEFKIAFPEIKEQQKIASFLSAIDIRIDLLEQKKAKLEEYKKGIMQKIFSQEIRFKDEDGKEYPVWNKKKLRDILTYEQPTKYLVESTEYDNGFETPVLTAGKTFILGYTDETEGIFTKLPVIIFDDFTTAFKYVDFPFKAKSSAMKMLIPNSNEVNIKFVFEAMGRIKFPLAEHKRYWISEFQHMKIPYPCIEEQSKIATFLTSIDRKIALVQKQIDGSNQFKKGLLQQMFV
ncbi:hypothetical protein HC174_08690 [Salinimicrobium sp. CDJ15-81-2]|nr:hypothetical protein [Salinimicrobium nanhaiense]